MWLTRRAKAQLCGLPSLPERIYPLQARCMTGFETRGRFLKGLTSNAKRLQCLRVASASLFLLLMTGFSAQAQFEAYLFMSGIPGEATETNHLNWIEVLRSEEHTSELQSRFGI